jgi:8-oxo-dGTP pyrophosphatase MutT (NUDIX family)
MGCCRVDPFVRDEYSPGHFTASAFILHPDGEPVLLVHHGKIGIWVQPGVTSILRMSGSSLAARREVAEETGITDLTPITDGCSTSTCMPPKLRQPRHLHFDLRFGSPGDGAITTTAEVRDCRWVAWRNCPAWVSAARRSDRWAVARRSLLPPVIRRAIDAALLKRGRIR